MQNTLADVRRDSEDLRCRYDFCERFFLFGNQHSPPNEKSEIFLNRFCTIPFFPTD